MSASRAVRRVLLDSPAVVNVVGQQIHPDRLEQDTTFPAITYGQVAERRFMRHEGPPTLLAPIVQVSCWAKRKIEAEDLARKIREALDYYVGVVSFGGSSLDVQRMTVQPSPGHLYDEDRQLYQVPVDVEVVHSA